MRRVVTLFEARGAEYIRAQLGTMRSGFGNLRGEMERTNRTGGLVNNQLRALGTTLRYAFAGSAIYGSMQIVRNLGQFEAKLGEISAIATTTGGIPLIGQQLTELGDLLVDVSNKTTIPIEQLQEGVINLYSTLEDVPPNEAARMMEEISKVAITSQSNIEDTTGALLGMIDAFGAGTEQIGEFGNQFYTVIRESAQMSGHVYAQQLGRLASSAALGQFNPQEMGALAIASTRFGGSAAVNQRGLAQLMLYLMNPRGKEAETTMASLGLGPQQRVKMGGWDVLMKVLSEINKRGGVGATPALRGATDETFGLIQEAGLTPQQAGIRGGGARLATQITGRIESQRILAILSNMLTPAQVAGTPNKTLDQYLDDVTESAIKTDQAFDQAMNRRRIVEAGNAVHNLGIEIGTAMSPLIGPVAGQVTRGISAFGTQKWGFNVPGTDTRITGQQAELAAAGTGAAGLLALLRRRGVAGAGRRALGGLGGANAALNAITETEWGKTPLKPFYVTVVNDLLRGRQPGTPPAGAAESVEQKASKWGFRGWLAHMGFKGITSRIGGGSLAAASLLGAEMPAIPDMISMLTGGDPFGYRNKPDFTGRQAEILRNPKHRWLRNILGSQGGANPTFGVGFDDPRRKAAYHRLAMLSSQAVRAQDSPLLQPWKPGTILGKAEVTVNLEDKDGRKKRKTVHATVDLFPDFTVPAPTTKAKPTTQRGGK
jgi:hypothetical protein